jgi:hypothetical protein
MRFYGFLEIFQNGTPRIENLPAPRGVQEIEKKQLPKWYSDCYYVVASDVGVAGRVPASPRKRRRPVTVTAQEAALKRELPTGKSPEGAVGDTTAPP